MASGLPVITTDDPGYDMYQLDRELVRLVPRRVLELRAAILELVADPHLRARMGRYSHATAARSFDWAVHRGSLLALYRSALEHGGSPPRRRVTERGGKSGVEAARAVSETHSE